MRMGACFAVLALVSCARPPEPHAQATSTPPAKRRGEAAGSAASQEIPPHLACSEHSDCSVEPPPPCGCSPCSPEAKVAANVAHVAWLQKEYAREQCPHQEAACPPCAPGTDAVIDARSYCVRGRCEMQPNMPAVSE